MSLLLVLNDINRHGKFKGKSCVTRCENSKSRVTLLGQITSQAANLGAINSRWKFGSLHASRKTYTTLWNQDGERATRVIRPFSSLFPCCTKCRWNKIPAPAGRIEPSVTILNEREKRIRLWLDPGGLLGLIFFWYVPLASQNPYFITVYSVAKHRPHLSHF